MGSLCAESVLKQGVLEQLFLRDLLFGLVGDKLHPFHDGEGASFDK